MGARQNSKEIRCIRQAAAPRTLSFKHRSSTFTTLPGRNVLFKKGKQARSKISRNSLQNFITRCSAATATASRFWSRKRIPQRESVFEENWKKSSPACDGAFMSRDLVRKQTLQCKQLSARTRGCCRNWIVRM